MAAKWFDSVLATYPADTAKFLRKQKDRFANPVGQAISEGVEGILAGLIEGAEPAASSTFLDNIIRIRAIQEFTPAQALEFIFLLKKVLREELESEVREHALLPEMLEFESRIDDLAKLSFNIYMECRERLFQIRVTEFRNASYKLLQRAGLLAELEADLNHQTDNAT